MSIFCLNYEVFLVFHLYFELVSKGDEMHDFIGSLALCDACSGLGKGLEVETFKSTCLIFMMTFKLMFICYRSKERFGVIANVIIYYGSFLFELYYV